MDGVKYKELKDAPTPVKAKEISKTPDVLSDNEIINVNVPQNGNSKE